VRVIELRSRRPKTGAAAPPPAVEETGLIRDTAVRAAMRAGDIQMHHFRNPALKCRQELHDVKLDTDLKSERAIIAAIRDNFPHDAVWAEESGLLPGAGRRTWVVDPLDGTVNFWHGLPIFCVSVACYRNDLPSAVPGLPGAPVAGVVYLPCSREMFVGARGSGATLNARQLGVAPARELGEVMLSLSFGKTPERMRLMTARLGSLLPKVRKARCLGAAAVEMAYVAAGWLGGMIYEGLKPWDFAAGKILVEEAGGFVQAHETEPGLWQLAAGPAGLQAEILSLLAD
jgi:fructose-1,6-bisphosphatase/inositol monophosphatase family enzyme